MEMNRASVYREDKFGHRKADTILGSVNDKQFAPNHVTLIDAIFIFQKKDLTCEFRGLVIEHVSKEKAQDSLNERKSIRVDPFKQGFDHGDMDVNLSAVRLCFQVVGNRYKPERVEVRIHLIYRSSSNLSVAA